MARGSRLRFIFIALLLIPLSVSAVLGQRSGVLIGVAGASTDPERETKTFDSIHAPTYQTMWIASDSKGELKVLASLPELIVPRKDGFWHAGVIQLCEFDADPLGTTGGNERLLQVVWTAPMGKAGTVEHSHPCAAHTPEDYAPPYGRSEQDQHKISQCGFALVDLLYVSPELISTSTYSGQSEDCEERGGRYEVQFKVQNFDSDEGLSFGQLLGRPAHDAYLRALPGHGVSDFGGECAESQPGFDTGWRIAHGSGKWRAYVHQDLGFFGCVADAPIKFPLPVSLTGDRSTSISSAAFDWKALRSIMPEATDAYASPAGDLLIAVSAANARIFELRGGVPGKLLLTLPASRIVMVQWASGRHVQDWTATISAFAQQGIVEPVIKVSAPAN